MVVFCLQEWLLVVLLLLMSSPTAYFATKEIECPQYCKCSILSGARSAACVGQRLSNIDTGVPRNVQILDLSNNSISTLGNEEFKNLGLTFILKLQLHHNHIGNIELHAFAAVSELRILDLSYNHLYHLLPATFEDTPQLRSLYLQGNRLKIYFGPILIIPSLEILDLSFCQIDHFNSESFLNLPSLLSLNLTSNQLIRLEVEVLEPLKSLQTIGLKSNPWSCDGKAYELEARLTNLHIEHDLGCKKKTKSEDKFQRIISVVESSESQNDTEIISDDEFLRLWSLKENVKNSNTRGSSNNSCRNIDNNSISKKEGILELQVFNKIPSFWSLVIGLEIGIVIGGFTMWLLLREYYAGERERNQTSPRRRSRSMSAHRSLQMLQNRASFHRVRSIDEDSTMLCDEVETINCPETPPPPYRHVWENLHTNNVTR